MNFVIKKVLLTTLLCLFWSISANAKPLPSLSVQMHWQNDIQLEQSNVIQIILLSHISTSQLQLDISLPEGVSLLKGQKQYLLTMEKGKTKELQLEVYVDKSAVGNIKAEARVGEKGEAMFYAADAINITSAALSQSIKPRNKSEEPQFKRTERNGVKLREYRLSQ